jgi:DNA-binding transcriptional ArsR family regulator
MRDGPDIALTASLIGDPARAHMLLALLSGQALTAGELAREAGVSLQTGSFHLAKLEDAGLIAVRKAGRHRYVRLSGPEVAAVIEALLAASALRGPRRVRPGPKDAALREARVCFDHLAGDFGVRLFDQLLDTGLVIEVGDTVALAPSAAARLKALGLDVGPALAASRPVCRACLDWSARRNHLAGALGQLVLERIYAAGWAEREAGTRLVRFSPSGRRAFDAWLQSFEAAEAAPDQRVGTGVSPR